jgi:hypothetical protein
MAQPPHLIQGEQLVTPVQDTRVGHVLHLHVEGVKQEAAIRSALGEGGTVDGPASSLQQYK